MKKFKFLGAIAFALVLSLNADVFLDDNNWETSTEVIEAQLQVTRTTGVIAIGGRQPFGIPCIIGGSPGVITTCPWVPWNSTCTPRACSPL